MRSETARDLLDLALSRPATLGTSRLIAVDGPSGSGKSSLAAAVSAEATARGISHTMLPLDHLYAGWSGLPAIGGTLDALLRPLATGLPGAAATWNWEDDGPGPDLFLTPTELLVVEGVGAGHRRIADLVTVLAWLQGAGQHGDLERALRRDEQQHPSAAADPSAYRAKLEGWQRSEAEHFAVDAPWERADISLG